MVCFLLAGILGTQAGGPVDVRRLANSVVLAMPGGGDREYAVTGSGLTLGRASTNDVVLADPTVSGSHARIERGDRGYVLVDLGSTTGTRLKGRPVQRAVLSTGDVISLGECTLFFRVLAEEQEWRDDVADLQTIRDVQDQGIPGPHRPRLHRFAVTHAAAHLGGAVGEGPGDHRPVSRQHNLPRRPGGVATPRAHRAPG